MSFGFTPTDITEYDVVPIIVNLDGAADAYPEVILGGAAYEPETGYEVQTVDPITGMIRTWSSYNGLVEQGYPAVLQIVQDAYPEILYTGEGDKGFILDHKGELLSQFSLQTPLQDMDDVSHAGPSTIANFDPTDNLPEFGVVITGTRNGVSVTSYVVFDVTLLPNDTFEIMPRWSYEIEESTSGVTPATAFDFDGDGRVEIVHRDESSLRILRVPMESSNLLSLLSEWPHQSETFHEYCSIADINNDGKADLVVPVDGGDEANDAGLFFYQSDYWVSARPLWNQHTYHITNINDDGSIPAFESPSWLSDNTYRANRHAGPVQPSYPPDLIPSYVRVDRDSSGVADSRLTVRVGNAGTFSAPAGINVYVYATEPNQLSINGATAHLGQAITTRVLAPGTFEDVTIELASSVSFNESSLWFGVDPRWQVQYRQNGLANECNENNNVYHNGIVLIPTNTNPRFTSTHVRTGAVTQSYIYDVEATDDDNPGSPQVLVYDFLRNPEGMAIDPVSGVIEWIPTVKQSGEHPVVIRVQDGYGGKDIERFTIDVFADNIPPDIRSIPETITIVDEPYQYRVIAHDSDPLRYYVDPISIDRGVEFTDINVLTWTPPTPGFYTISVFVADDRGRPVRQDIPLQVVAGAPGISFGNLAPLFVDQPWHVDITASAGVGAQSITDYLLDDVSVERGMSIVSLADGQRRLTWTPKREGPFVTTVTVRNNLQETRSAVLRLHVNLYNPANEAPEIEGEPQGPAVSGIEWSFPFTIWDAEQNNVEVTVTPGFFYALDPITKIHRIYRTFPVPGPGEAASAPFTFEVQLQEQLSGGATGHTVTYTYTIPIVDGSAPAFATAPVQMPIPTTGPTVINLKVVDWDSDPLRFEVLFPAPAGTLVFANSGRTSTFDPNGVAQMTLTYTPSVNLAGSRRDLRLRVTDKTGRSDEHTILLDIYNPASNSLTGTYTAPNEAAVGEIFEGQAKLNQTGGEAYYYLLATEDGAPMDKLLLGGQGPEITIDKKTGRVTWVPAAAHADAHTPESFSYFVGMDNDTNWNLGHETIMHTVTVVTKIINHPPKITSHPNDVATLSRPMVFQFTADDKDNNPLTWDLSSGPSTASITRDGRFYWLPTEEELDEPRTATVEVSDGKAKDYWEFPLIATRSLAGAPPFTWPPATDTPPSFVSIPLAFAVVNLDYSHQVIINDPDVGTTGAISYGLSASAPDGRSITLTPSHISSAGLLSWTPGAGDVGYIDVILTAQQNNVIARYPYTLLVTNAGSGNQPPILQPAITLKATAGTEFVFDVPASDAEDDPLEFYFLDNPNKVRSWSALTTSMQMTPDGRVTWDVPASAAPNTSVTFTAYVQDQFGRSVTRTYNVLVQADQHPAVSLSANNMRPYSGSVVAFTVIARDDVGLKEVRLILQYSWDPATTFVYPKINPNGIATIQVPVPQGSNPTITARAIAIDTGENATTSYPIVLQIVPAPVDPPVIDIVSPSPDGFETIEKATQLRGRIYDPNNQLRSYAVIARPRTSGAAIPLLEASTTQGSLPGFGGSTSGPVDIVLIDPLSLPQGMYDLEVTATDADGFVTTDTRTIEIDSAAKLGNFTLSFTDLTIPVGGFPVSIVRNYDSLNANTQGEFGYGWSLQVVKGKMEIETAANPNNAFWKSLGYDPPLYGGGRMTVTLPTGEKHGFTAVPVPIEQKGDRQVGAILSLANIYALAFQPDPNQGSRLDFTDGGDFLYPKNFIDLLPQTLFHETYRSLQVVYDEGTGEFRSPGTGSAGSNFGIPINPSTFGWNYRLTTREGAKYIFNSATGEIMLATDSLGNRFQSDDRGMRVLDKDGQKLAELKITRQNGLITRVEDPLGNAVTYGYTNGDLTSVTDREANRLGVGPSVKYNYGSDDAAHRLISIVNMRLPQLTAPYTLGRTVLQVAYDATGRILGMQDSVNLATFNFSSSGLGPSVTANDVLGSTQTQYDPKGNILKTAQRISGNDYIISEFAYDDEGNQTIVYEPYRVTSTSPLTETLPSNQPFRKTTYDKDRRPTEIADPLDHKTQFLFDKNTGALLEITDPLGNVTYHDYDDAGNLTETLDAENRFTTYEYGILGALHRVVRYHDVNTEIASETIDHDIAGRPIQVTSGTDVERYLAYDATGNQTHTWHVWTDPQNANNTTTIATVSIFDAEDRNIESRQYVLTGVAATTNAALEASLVGKTPAWTTKTQYDLAGRVVATTDRFGMTTYSLYDAMGNVIETRSQTDKTVSGRTVYRVVRTYYDEHARVVASSDPFLVTNPVPPTSSIFNLTGSNGDTQITTPQDIRLTHTKYDNAGRVIETRKLRGCDASGNCAAPVTPLAIGLTMPQMGVPYFFTTFGESYSEATHLLSREVTSYDAAGRVWRTEHRKWNDNTGLITEFIYDAAGRQIRQIVDPTNAYQLKVETSFEYDDAGRRIKTIENSNNGVSQADSQITESVYDKTGLVVQVTQRNHDNTLRSTVQTVYDGAGRRIAEIDPLGRQTEYTYDDFGRLSRVTLPGAVDNEPGSPSQRNEVPLIYQYDYDPYGNQTSIQDPRNKVTRLAFDFAGNQISRSLPLAAATPLDPNDFVETSQYHTSGLYFGMLQSTTDFEGRTTTYTYDTVGRVQQKQYAQTGLTTRTVSFTYDAFDRVVTIDDSVDGLTTHTYDADGRLSQLDSRQGTIKYQYDSATGELTRTEAKAGTAIHTATNYAYDRLGRLTSTTLDWRQGTDVANEVTQYKYDKLNRIEYEKSPSGATKDIIYDALGRVDRIDHFVDSTSGAGADGVWNGSERRIASFDYSYDLAGRRTASEEWIDKNNDGTADVHQKFTWSYDNVGRLIQEMFDENVNGWASGADYIDRYSFDRAGNRVQKTRNLDSDAAVEQTINYMYDSNDRLTTEIATGTSAYSTTYEYSYLLGGATKQATQQTKKIVSVSGTVTETHTYTYDERGRLKTSQVVKPGFSTVNSSYQYNESGMRVSQTVDGETTIYLLDPHNPTGYVQVLEEGVDLNGNGKLDQTSEIRATYTLGLDVITHATPLLASPATPARVMHLLYDAHGSTRALLNTGATIWLNGSTPQVYSYDAYGQLLAFTGTPLTGLLYSGEKTDSTTGLQYLRARYYDPAVGRFNSLDPFAGNMQDPRSFHEYGYVYADPVQGVDPSGEIRLLTLVAGISAFAGIAALTIGAPGLWARFGKSYGIPATAAPQNIAVVVGDLGIRGDMNLSMSGVSIVGFSNELRSMGHNVQYVTSPSELQMINLLNNNDIVIAVGHGPSDANDRNRKPVAAISLGGLSTHKFESPVFPIRNGIESTTGVTLPPVFVTANELRGNVHNNDLIFVVPGCNAGKTSGLYKSSGARIFVGCDKLTNGVNVEHALQWVTDYLRDGEQVANNVFLNKSKHNVINPQNDEF